jgi:hypothetical protein
MAGEVVATYLEVQIIVLYEEYLAVLLQVIAVGRISLHLSIPRPCLAISR